MSKKKYKKYQNKHFDTPPFLSSTESGVKNKYYTHKGFDYVHTSKFNFTQNNSPQENRGLTGSTNVSPGKFQPNLSLSISSYNLYQMKYTGADYLY